MKLGRFFVGATFVMSHAVRLYVWRMILIWLCRSITKYSPTYVHGLALHNDLP
jgi:hypothetical protein